MTITLDSVSLAGRTALVTGASRGIGAGIALELAKRGADVHVHYSSSPDKADEVVKAIQQLGRKADKIKGDLAEKSIGRTLCEAVKASSFGGGKLDILVLNGAVSWPGMLEEIDEDKIDEHYTMQMDINVRSTIIIVNASLPLLNRGSRIILVSSGATRMEIPAYTVYGATEAALEHFARVWSKELGQKYGVTVNCVNPGPALTLRLVDTEMLSRMPEEFQVALDQLVKQTPAEPRKGTIDDIAQIVAFLASEGSRWVTGSTVCANGGILPN